MPGAGFCKVDWGAPIDVDTYLAACPADAAVRGVVLNGVRKKLERRGVKPPPEFGPFPTFKAFPLRDHMRLTAEAAKLAYPHAPLRLALRELGQTAYPEVLETLIGRVVFGVVGKDPGAVFKLASKAYEIVGSRARARVVETGAHHAHLHITDAFGFLDAFQVGVTEGVLLACGRLGEVWIKVHSLSEAEIWVEWT